MDKIIKGKRYSTDSAELIATCENESLYLKQTGEYFLCSGELVTPISRDKAHQWAGLNISNDEYVKKFFPADMASITQLSFRVTIAEAHKLRQHALNLGVPQLTLFKDWIATLK